MEWKCIGFSLRRWPWDGPLTADLSEWEMADAPWMAASMHIGLNVNLLQLVGGGRVDDVIALRDFVIGRADCDLVRIEVPAFVADRVSAKHGVEMSVPETPDLPLEPVGLDICDIDGLFSVLHNPELIRLRGHRELFDPSNLCLALEYLQYASFLDPGHAPLAVCRVSTLKTRVRRGGSA